jgi:shikimate dehydrogenase
MRPYAEVIGDPITQSKSPLIHNFWLAKFGIEADYRTCHVHPEELPDYFAQRRKDPAWRGCNITIPHKIAALNLVDVVEWDAEKVGATNCVVPVNGRLVAHNTDINGVDQALQYGQSDVCLIGAGGAARAVFPTLNVLCAMEIRVVARDPEKARASLDGLWHDFSFFGFDQAEDALRDVETIINASPLGMTGQPEMPAAILANLQLASDRACVFDMVYAPLETALLRAARAHGLEAIDGLHMLIGQAAAAFGHFFGQSAPREHDTELRALLTQ